MVLALGLASLLAPLNSTMVAVALPDIRSQFDVGVIAATWLVTGYLVAVAVAQPVGGRLGDRLGHARMLKGGLVLMAAFSLLSALSPNYAVLVITRSLQGVAAAVLIPNATAYLRRAVDVERLGGSVGSVGAFTAAGAAIGPVVGGLLLAAGDWRLLFLANLPVAALAMLLVLGLPREQRSARPASGVETPSIIALAAAFAGLALVGTAIRSESPLFAAAAGALALAGVAAYAAWFRLRRAGVVDLRLFTSRAYASAAAMTCLANLVMYTTLISVPVYLRDERGTGTAAIGAILFAMSATMAGLSWFGGRLGDALGARAVLVSGAIAITASAAAVGVSLQFTSMPLLVIALAGLGVGMGISMPVQQTIGLAAWPPHVAGSAAGTLSLTRYVGSVAGASLAAAVLGASPARGHFEALIALLTAVAVVNLLVAALPLGGRASEMAPEPA